jgi:hypothetical protein
MRQLDAIASEARTVSAGNVNALSARGRVVLRVAEMCDLQHPEGHDLPVAPDPAPGTDE